MDTEFDTLAKERRTPTARSCIAIARNIFASKGGENDAPIASITEARAWVKLALEADNTSLAERLKVLEDKFGEKTSHRETAERLRGRKKASGDNVVDFPSKDSI